MRSPSQYKFCYPPFLIIAVQFFCFLVSLVQAQGPLLYPDAGQNGIFVGHLDATSLIPLQGSYRWFLCGHPAIDEFQKSETRVRCASVSSIVIYTSHDRLLLRVANLSARGVPIPFQQKLQISAPEGSVNHSTRGIDVRIAVSSLENGRQLAVKVLTQGWSQEITIEQDTVPPSLSMTHVIEAEGTTQFIRFRIEFSEYVYVRPKTQLCRESFPRLRPTFTADDLWMQSAACFVNLDEEMLEDAIEIDSGHLFKGRRNPVIALFSGETFIVILDVIADSPMQNEVGLTIPADAFIDKAGNGNVNSTIYAVPLSDLAPEPMVEPIPGESMPEPVEGPVIEPVAKPAVKTDSRESRSVNTLDRWRPFSATLVGDAFVILTSSSIVMSFAASMISSSLGSDMNPGAMKLVGFAQKLYMMGRLSSYEAMPVMYRDFTDQFDWSMFADADTYRTLSGDSGEPSFKRRMLLQSAGVLDFPYEGITKEEKYFNRMVVWVSITFFGVFACHSIIVLIIFLLKRQIPAFFRFPRLEIMFAYFSIPVIVMASTALYADDRRHAFVATWMLIAFPACFLCWNISVIWGNFFSIPLTEQKALMFVDIREQFNQDSHFFRRAYEFLSGVGREPVETAARTGVAQSQIQEIEMTPQSGLPGPSSGYPAGVSLPVSYWDTFLENDDTETTTLTSYTRSLTASSTTREASSVNDGIQSCAQCLKGFFNATLVHVALGRRQLTPHWTGVYPHGNDFISKYGFLFEDYRGPPVIREDATYMIDRTTGRLNRGDIVLLTNDSFVECRCLNEVHSRIYLDHIHLLMKMLELVKLIVLASLVGSIGATRQISSTEMMCLVVLSLTMLIIVRMTRPYQSRLDMAVGMLAEFADFIVYCSLYAVSRCDCQDERFSEQMGVMMLVVESFALSCMIVRYAFVTMYVTLTCMAFQKQRQPTRFSEIVDRMIRTRVPTILQQKYFDRWMVKTLGKGFKGRKLDISELPRTVVVQNLLRQLGTYVKSVLHPCGSTDEQRSHYHQ